MYDFADLDHEGLFARLEQAQGDFIMTYDNDPDVQTLADKHNFASRAVPMQSTHHAEMTELLIGRSLAWINGMPTPAIPADEDTD